MKSFYYSPDRERAVSVNNRITIKELTGSDDWKYMIQSSSDGRIWTAYTAPTVLTINEKRDHTVVYTIPPPLEGKYIRVVIGGDAIPLEPGYSLTGESCSPVYRVLSVADFADSVISDIEVRSADNLLVSKNDHGVITTPILHLNREPVKEDFQNFENVLAIVNRPTHFTFEPAPLFFNSQNGFSQYSYVSSNTHWRVKSKPDYIQIVREGRALAEGYGTLAFHVNVIRDDLQPGLYNDYIIFEDVATGEEIHVPFQIDVDVPLTVNEQPEVVNLAFSITLDTEPVTVHELRIVRDRYWRFVNFESLERDFIIGRLDGSHNAVTTLTLRGDHGILAGTANYTFFAVSNNYIVRINVAVTIQANYTIFPRSFVLERGQVAGFNTINRTATGTSIDIPYPPAAATYATNSDFETVSGTAKVSQIITVIRSNYDLRSVSLVDKNVQSYDSVYENEIKVRIIPSGQTGVPKTDANYQFDLTYLGSSPFVGGESEESLTTIDRYKVTFDPDKAELVKSAGMYACTIRFEMRALAASSSTFINCKCYYNVPRRYFVSTVNEKPNAPGNHGVWEKYVGWDGSSAETSLRVPYLYTTLGTTLNTKPSAPIYVGVNGSGYSISDVTNIQRQSVSIQSGDIDVKFQAFVNNPQVSIVKLVHQPTSNFTSLRQFDLSITLTINSVSMYGRVNWSTTSPEATPLTVTEQSVPVPILMEARRQHFLRANDIGTLLPDFNYRRLGAPFVHNPECQISVNSTASKIELLLHKITTAGNGYELTASGATHVGAQYTGGLVDATHEGAQFVPSGQRKTNVHDLVSESDTGVGGGYNEFGRNNELSLISTVPSSYANDEFIGDRVITASLQALVYHGYGSANLLPVAEARHKKQGAADILLDATIALETHYYEHTSYSGSSPTSIFQDNGFAVRFNSTNTYENFRNRENCSHQVYTFATPRVIRGLAIHQPPPEYENVEGGTSGASGASGAYYIETRIKYNDDTYGNWQPLMVTQVKLKRKTFDDYGSDTGSEPLREMTITYRTCVPRLASEIRVFRKHASGSNLISQQSTSGSRTLSIAIPFLHFYENTPLFYTANSTPNAYDYTDTAILGCNEAVGGQLPGRNQSLPFFNSHIGYYLISMEANEEKKWDDIADSIATHANEEKSATTYISSDLQNVYRYNLVSTIDSNNPGTSRSIYGYASGDNYVKLVPARRQSRFTSNVIRRPEVTPSEALLPNTAHTSISHNYPIWLAGAILYPPYDRNKPFAGGIVMQNSLGADSLIEDDNWIWAAANMSASGAARYAELGNKRYITNHASFAVFSVGNYFGGIRFDTANVKTTAYLRANPHLLDTFVTAVKELVPYTQDKSITIVNDHPTQGNLLRKELDPITGNWVWNDYGSTLVLRTPDSNTIDAFNNIVSDPTHVHKNKILENWFSEVNSRSPNEKKEALAELSIYAKLNDTTFRRYRYNNDHSTDGNGLLTDFNGTWQPGVPFSFEIERFYHKAWDVLNLQPIRYLSFVCVGLVNVFNERERILQYGDIQLFHRYRGIELFFENLPETTFRRSKLNSNHDRYYGNTYTYTSAGWAKDANNRELAEDWVDCYYDVSNSYVPLKPRQTVVTTTNFNTDLRTEHAFQDEATPAVNLTRLASTITLSTASSTQSSTLCIEPFNVYRFGMPTFTYIRFTE